MLRTNYSVKFYVLNNTTLQNTILVCNSNYQTAQDLMVQLDNNAKNHPVIKKAGHYPSQ